MEINPTNLILAILYIIFNLIWTEYKVRKERKQTQKEVGEARRESADRERDLERQIKQLKLDLIRREEENHMHSYAFKNGDDALFYVDNNGTIKDMNFAAEFLTGYSRRNLLNSPIGTIIPDSMVETHRIYLDNYFKTPMYREMARNERVMLKDKAGELIHVFISLKPSMSPDNKTIALATVRRAE